MRIKSVTLKEFKRFSDLRLDLGDNSAKIVALIRPNGCGKSSIFDAFNVKLWHDGFNRRAESSSYYIKHEETSDTNPLPNDSYDYLRDGRVRIETNAEDQKFNKTNFYMRTAYRATTRLQVDSIERLGAVEDTQELLTTIDTDERLAQTYERLIGQFFDEVYGKNKTGADWEKEKIQEINSILKNILDIDITLLGNPTDGRGTLYFSKGQSKNFPYDLLSSGEKEVINLILDLKVKTKTYTDTIFCIDEPELHLNTSIQGNLFIELDKLINDNCQLWVATHSIGFMRALQEMDSSKY